MQCALPLSKLLFSSPMANLSNTKAFSHADPKFSLQSNKRSVAGGRFFIQLHTRFKLEHTICALATVESEALATISSWESHIGADLNIEVPPYASQEDSDVDEKERLRRSRISRANKGNTPWNKGKKHSPGTNKIGKHRRGMIFMTRSNCEWDSCSLVYLETVQRIRERTKIAMQNPKIKEAWRRRRETRMIQEACHVEWCKIIAEAARVGFYGDKELHWD